MKRRWFNQSKLVDYVHDKLDYKYTSGDEMICDCCFCGHSDTMWVNRETAQFTCYRCLEGGSAYAIIEKVDGVSTDQARIILGVKQGELIQPADDYATMFDRFKTAIVEPVNKSNAVMPECTKFFGYQNPEYQLEHQMMSAMLAALNKRGFDWAQIVDNRVGWAFGGKYDQRVILPAYFRNELVWWQAWDYTRSQAIKYTNPRNDEVRISRKALVYNIEKYPQAESLVVVEGIFNAWALDQIGVPGVATFGKAVTPIQLFQLVTHRASRIYIGLDDDARQQAVKLYEVLRAYGKEALICTMPVKRDWNDLQPQDRSTLLQRAGHPDWFFDGTRK